MNLFAQLPALPDPTSAGAVGWVLAVLFGLCAGALTIKLLFQRTPPLGEEFVTRREFEALEKRIDEKIDELGTQLASNNEAGEKRVVALQDRINALPGEIIKLLRQTKDLL